MMNNKADNKSYLEQTISAAKEEREEREATNNAKKLGISYVNLAGFPINFDTLSIFEEAKAKSLKAVPYLQVGKNIRVAATDPKSEELNNYFEELKRDNELKFTAVLASRSSINYGLSLYQKLTSQKTAETEKINSSSTTSTLNSLLSDAADARSSDIHIIPSKEGAAIRFRVDGVLHDISKISREKYKSLSSRIKFLSHMKMDEEHLPQDGRFSITINNREIDLRVSALPTINGDSLVARLLEEKEKTIKLSDLGFNKKALEAIKEAAKKPSGLILNTGPTGSGKTTTLYAILNLLNQREVKIVTLEDPVEYQIKGIEQTQIDPRHNLDFSVGLRAALRQDPDIIMVGEIRDSETASIALHAALTGHLVLTTLHTNNAPAALVRLLDMKIKPYLLVGSINLALAQRLVRLICPKCKKRYSPSRPEKKIIDNYLKKRGVYKTPTLYKGVGCPACSQTGYLGRTAIVEFLVPNEKIEKLIIKRATQTQVERVAIKLGMKTMREDGLDKVLAGETSIEEILRVT